MTRLKDKLGMFLIRMRFKGKGNSNLKKLSRFTRSLEAWRTRVADLKRGILTGAGLHPLPKRTLLNPVFHGVRYHSQYSVSNVYFESIPGFFVTGNLYEPFTDNEMGKIPVVLKPHGHFKHGRFRQDNQQICATLARLGARVFTYDMIGYGDSTQLSHKIPNALTLQIWNSIRAVDFTINLGNSDPDHVAITGASGGGTQSFLLAAIDERITLSAPLVMVSSRFYGGCTCESGKPIHDMTTPGTNNAEIAAAFAPKPQLILSISTDWTRYVPQVEFPFIQEAYRLTGASNMVENVHITGERHDLGPSKRDATCRFIAKHFNLDINVILDPAGNIDESSNIIEDPSVMASFNDKHPRPVRALIGEDTILETLARLQVSQSSHPGNAGT
ncbi:acetylxylan esterase [Candidatus Bathyarchaeota archaeon]|nr:acetylxylan esterase [Candidatus Bathyarchaeota archaeon]